MHIILAILISFWSNKIGVYNMRQIKKLTWLQACFLGNVGVIWCNSLGENLFQIYVMNFVEIVLNYYSHITSHVSQDFASCTPYTSYFLLNFVDVIVCVFGLTDQISWVLCKTHLMVEILREWIENLNFGKTGFKTSVFWEGFHLILMQFIHKIQCFEEYLQYFALLFKNLFFPESFGLALCISINQIYFSINRNCN